MNRAEILSLLERHRDDLKRRFAAKHIAVFGSAARDEMHEGSDVDVLVVEFEGSATFDGYMDLKFYLEVLFGTRADLVTADSVKPRMHPMIEQEIIRIA